GAIADGNCGGKWNAFVLRNAREQFRLPRAIHNFRTDFAGDAAVANLEIIGVNEIQSELRLQPAAYERESAGEYCCLASALLQSSDEMLGAFGERDALKQRTDFGLVQSLQQRDALAEALLEIEFAAHGCVGDLRHLIAHSREPR